MTSRRTRTPSDLKFLLNERAALVGQIRSGARDCRPLEAEASKLEARARMLRDQVAAIQAERALWQAKLDAIDAVLRQTHREVAPEYSGVVSAWAGKYGRRGELKSFVLSTVRAAPNGVPTGVLVDAVISHFHLALSTSEARTRLRHVISKRLHQSEAQGLLYSVPGQKGGQQTVWRWNTGISAADLARAAMGEADDKSSNPLRGEVGG